MAVPVGVALTKTTYVEAIYPHIAVSVYDKRMATVWENKQPYPNLQDGIDCLQKTIGSPYSLWDVLDGGLANIGIDWYAQIPQHYDCSALATTFLEKAGYSLDMSKLIDASRVSPNDLARILGILS